MRISIIQTNPIFGNVMTNISSAIQQMSSVNADLFILPELFNTGYNFSSISEIEQLAETTDGHTFQKIAQFTKRKNCYCVYGFAEKNSNNNSATRFFNSSALVGPDGLIGIYRKVHLYFRENIFFFTG